MKVFEEHEVNGRWKRKGIQLPMWGRQNVNQQMLQPSWLMALEGISSQGRGEETTSGRPEGGWGQLDMLLIPAPGERRGFLWCFTSARHPPSTGAFQGAVSIHEEIGGFIFDLFHDLRGSFWMFCTLWARGCQTFRLEREQKCFTVSAVINPGQQRGPGARAGKFLCIQMQPGFCWRKPNAGFQGPCPHSERRSSPAAVPPHSAQPHSPLLPAPGWSKTIVAARHTPQQIPAVKHLGKCCFFTKKKPLRAGLWFPASRLHNPNAPKDC